jgi:hypothetical protein
VSFSLVAGSVTARDRAAALRGGRGNTRRTMQMGLLLVPS